MPVRDKITKEKIIYAFLDSCFEKNAGGTSLADIATRLGIKKASLYNHYESRDAIVSDTIRWCGECMSKNRFIPAEIGQLTKQHSASAVVRALTVRWIKLNMQKPLFQIYSFIESEKFISNDAAKVSDENKNRLLRQGQVMFKSLADNGKIIDASDAELQRFASILANIINAQLEAYIIGRKVEMRNNPETGIGELFATPLPELNFDYLSVVLDTLCSFLKK